MSDVQIGQEYEGKVARVLNYGAIVSINDKTGLLHNNKLGKNKKATSILKIGDTLKVKVEEVKEDGKYSLSLAHPIEKKRHVHHKKKKPTKPYAFNPKIAWHTNWLHHPRGEGEKNYSFEERMKVFLKDSDEKRLDIKKSLEAKRG